MENQILQSKIVDAFDRTRQVSSSLTSEKAIEHLGYGLGRRLLILRHDFLEIMAMASSDRKKPLILEEQTILDVHLNSFYLHLCGSLDNLAWCLAYQTGLLGEADEFNPAFRRRVDLFREEYKKAVRELDRKVGDSLDHYSDWYKELRSVRDPVAHRIPLYAIPAVLNEDQEKQFCEAYTGYSESLAKGDLLTAETCLKKVRSVGDYRPLFTHRPGDAPKPIDSQVPNDLVALLDITNAVLSYLEAGMSAS